MGGSAFSSLPDGLYTPRMPRGVYQRVVSACHAALRELFICVATPIEGPGKNDHGDIDILVALERRMIFPNTPNDSVPKKPHELMEAIRGLLCAEYAIVHPTGESANLAIRWPSDMEHQITTGSGPCRPDEIPCHTEASKDKYIQVDVRICPDIDQLCWTLYKHAHGDIWNLIGSTIRPFGLTVDEEALWLRIPEIEKVDRRKAKVYLTRDPVEILHFLGMKVEGFWSEPFESVDALFDYATTCRLFWVRETPDGDAKDDASEAGVIGGDHGRRRLTANDRRRMNGRPVYRRWIDEFIPGLRAQRKFIRKGPGTSVEEMRAAVRSEAFARFFVQPEYKRRLREWRLKRESEQVKSLIKEVVPSGLDPPFRSVLVSAMRKILMEGDASFGVAAPPNVKDADGFYDMQIIRSFVENNWESVGKVSWEIQQQKAQEAMRLKAGSRNRQV
ncbi:hypothetical protein C8A03DRAFT_32474 [Achaetomium macrosporum]|uniref:Nucleotidyltransferase n=1 Tax=Achaetomium macrosporum TaxID=79813 RepID=A0AAN7CDA2_9PEZI|nr:hypothetical protein C8A03DRAFT_32474 [Achaetomium macrosporum]